jgi:hypothetical protein
MYIDSGSPYILVAVPHTERAPAASAVKGAAGVYAAFTVLSALAWIYGCRRESAFNARLRFNPVASGSPRSGYGSVN